MKKTLLKILLLLAFVSIVYAEANKTYEPAGKFIPTEKLRADAAIAFPVDI